MVKSISSRPDDGTVPLERISEVLHLLNYTLDRPGQPALTLEEALERLDEATVDLSVVYGELVDRHEMLELKLMRLTTMHTIMIKDYEVAQKVLRELLNPVNDGKLAKAALATLTQEGEPMVIIDSNLLDPADQNISLKFDEEKLQDALNMAITMYNNELVAAIVP